MRKSVVRRGIVFAVASVISAGGLAVIAAPASAHDVTEIDATCALVTVHFARFPSGGVPVTIAVQVGNQPPISDVINVNSSTSDESVDISTLTSQQYGATATVTVDVTWTLNGLNHVHQVLSVTCGSTTTTHPTTTTTHVTTTTRHVTTTTAHVTTTTRHTTTTTAHVTTTTQPQNGGNGDIFQVELRRCTQVHAGYQHFRAGTVIHWRVTQSGRPHRSGRFTTVSGKGYHFITQLIGITLRPAPVKGQILYTWMAYGRVQHYLVTREPGCSSAPPSGPTGPAAGAIREVDLRSCTLLHVGYSGFPAHTTVSWGVKQGNLSAAAPFKAIGFFVTAAGSGEHFLMPPLNAKLGHAVNSLVTFYWTSNGHHMSYSAIRKPGC